jgi:hypothetical protein
VVKPCGEGDQVESNCSFHSQDAILDVTPRYECIATRCTFPIHTSSPERGEQEQPYPSAVRCPRGLVCEASACALCIAAMLMYGP